MDSIEANKVVNEAFKAGYEEGRLEWPRRIPIALMPELDADYLAYGYMVPSSHRRPDDTPYWAEATFCSPTNSSGVPHWISKSRNYLFDVSHYLPLPPSPE